MRSLEQLERELFAPKPSVLTCPVTPAVPAEEGVDACAPGYVSLNGVWDMVADGNADRIHKPWADVIPASVPGSVHTALMAAGKIPDPTVGKNDAIAREESKRYWWLRRTFPKPAFEKTRLVFEGVCDRCTVWLNGRLLGGHQGMFGGPEYDITDLLKEENTLLVMLYPAPMHMGRREGELNPFFDKMNNGWIDTTVFNCVYGWHYASIPALGIWQSVSLQEIPKVEMVAPFASVSDLSGKVDVFMELEGPEGGFSGQILATVGLEGSEKQEHFVIPCESKSMHGKLHTTVTVSDPKLWWPNGLGEQNVYRLQLQFVMDGQVVDRKETEFGIRTIEMAPYLGKADEKIYNWQFVINGKEVFIKGANWCTLDYAMDFSEARYDRFLTLAKNQHLQLLRAWGGGLMETETFYRLCDRYGIMVLQEFPTAWDSQKVQPADILQECVIRNIKRLRSHPSLAMWCGGNEGACPVDAVNDMMGRLVWELDGTRVFHRNDPWGGSSHNYDVYWGRQDFDRNLRYADPFIGEFGFASSPNRESVEKYCTEEDFKVWPPVPGGNVEHHTPVFNTKEDMDILHRYIPCYLPDTSLDNMILSTQLCQVTTLRHTLELARTRRPEATGICYYKFTDVFPAVSWSTVDYYGVPKLSYYFVRNAFSPLHACILFDTLQPKGKAQKWPVHLIDDALSLEGKKWKVTCRAYGKELVCRETESWEGCGTAHTRLLGTFAVSEKTAAQAPLLVLAELEVEGCRVERSWYWLNFQEPVGCLFTLPKTTLTLQKGEGVAHITNTGKVPAVGVHFVCGKISHSFTPEDNFLWVEPGETVTVTVDRDDYAGVSAWNA